MPTIFVRLLFGEAGPIGVVVAPARDEKHPCGQALLALLLRTRRSACSPTADCCFAREAEARAASRWTLARRETQERACVRLHACFGCYSQQ
jgi:hypothetical protein